MMNQKRSRQEGGPIWFRLYRCLRLQRKLLRCWVPIQPLNQLTGAAEKSHASSLGRPWPPGKCHPFGELCNLAYGQCSSPQIL